MHAHTHTHIPLLLQPAQTISGIVNYVFVFDFTETHFRCAIGRQILSRDVPLQRSPGWDWIFGRIQIRDGDAVDRRCIDDGGCEQKPFERSERQAVAEATQTGGQSESRSSGGRNLGAAMARHVGGGSHTADY